MTQMKNNTYIFTNSNKNFPKIQNEYLTNGNNMVYMKYIYFIL